MSTLDPKTRLAVQTMPKMAGALPVEALIVAGERVTSGPMIQSTRENLKSKRYHVPNLGRALEIMEFLAVTPSGAGISEIAKRLTLPKNSVFRIISTLFSHGYLVRDESGRNYSLGRKLLALGYAAVDGHNLVEKAMGPMRKLHESIDETILLGTISGNDGVVLEQIYGRNPVKVVVDVGARFPLHTAAPAKAMLAFTEESERDAVIRSLTFERFNERTITNPDEFHAHLRNVRETGFAVDIGEEHAGINCIAAPVFDNRSRPVAALWVTGPVFRLNAEQSPEIVTRVIATALEISRLLGYEPLRRTK